MFRIPRKSEKESPDRDPPKIKKMYHKSLESDTSHETVLKRPFRDFFQGFEVAGSPFSDCLGFRATSAGETPAARPGAPDETP